MAYKDGIGKSKGNYLTSEPRLKSVRKYYSKFHRVQFRVPFGTKDKIYALSEKPQEFYNRILWEYIEKTTNPIYDTVSLQNNQLEK